ncbi:MAG: cyclic pyranopterin phosphate synthase [Nitriliruptoraceae bacterium]|jgi:cyclic pyranopterin phosphate synthase
MDTPPLDRMRRPLHDLRVSVTDRCNMRCRYCMPREVFGPDHAFLERSELLSFEEITRIVDASTRLGVHKLRLTGGEPLLRKGIAELVGMLSGLGTLDDLALTTNGVLLPTFSESLLAAGLTRLTVSLDALDQPTFKAVTDTQYKVEQVLEGMDAAEAAGFGKVKVNVVIRKGVNEHAITDLAGWGRETGRNVRFIEFMDVGTTNGWNANEVVSADEVLARISERWPVVPIDGPPGVAERYRYVDGAGEVGTIASVTRAFCRTCVRARVSAIGELFTCLFASSGTDLLPLVRGGADVNAVEAALTAVWTGRTDRYSMDRAADGGGGDKVEMSYIGG